MPQHLAAPSPTAGSFCCCCCCQQQRRWLQEAPAAAAANQQGLLTKVSASPPPPLPPSPPATHRPQLLGGVRAAHWVVDHQEKFDPGGGARGRAGSEWPGGQGLTAPPGSMTRRSLTLGGAHAALDRGGVGTSPCPLPTPSLPPTSRSTGPPPWQQAPHHPTPNSSPGRRGVAIDPVGITPTPHPTPTPSPGHRGVARPCDHHPHTPPHPHPLTGSLRCSHRPCDHRWCRAAPGRGQGTRPPPPPAAAPRLQAHASQPVSRAGGRAGKV